MESLVANYASSDEEEEQHRQQPPPKFTTIPSAKASSSFVSSLPQPKSSSSFSEPKKHLENPNTETPVNSFKPSSIFSSLPQPKSETTQHSTTRRVVNITPSMFKPSNVADEDDDAEEDELEKERKKRKESQFSNQTSSVKSFLSSIPAPKSSATLGSGSGSGRRSVIDTEVPALSSSGLRANNESSTDQDGFNYAGHDTGSGQNVGNYANYEAGVENYANYEVGSDQNVGGYVNYETYNLGIDQNMQGSDASCSANYGGYDGYGEYGQYGSTTMVQETSSVVSVPRKRGRDQIPTEIVEVKQDELMKDRPREDQVRMTGIAFGPSYQPVSTKGKPSKLHKRKHQIGTLYFDMRQKEAELTERRARGFQTKAQTQGKYGW